jgi:hypothetical protein
MVQSLSVHIMQQLKDESGCFSNHSTPSPGDLIEETDEFITTRMDTGGGPEVIAIQRK